MNSNGEDFTTEEELLIQEFFELVEQMTQHERGLIREERKEFVQDKID